MLVILDPRLKEETSMTEGKINCGEAYNGS
jgi:hypothetical protein